MDILSWCNRIIRWGFYLLFFSVPLIVTPANYELFEFNKMMLTYALTAIIVAAWATKIVYTQKLQIRKTPFDIPLFLFVISQFVSTLFSIDQHVSWWGYYSRFNGGMFSVFTYVLLYYAFVSNIETESKKPDASTLSSTNQNMTANIQPILPFLYSLLISVILVAIYGFLQRMGIDKHLWVQDVQSRVFSTLGQPNWLAAFLAAVLPLTFAFSLRRNNLQQPTTNPSTSLRASSQHLTALVTPTFLFWSTVSLLLTFVLINTRSRSGLLGAGVGTGLFWVVSYFKTLQKKTYAINGLVICSVLFMFLFFHGTWNQQLDSWITLKGWQIRLTQTQNKQVIPDQTEIPNVSAGTLLEFGGTESGTIRKYVWQAAVSAWQSSTKALLIGTGTETFAWTFFRYRPVEHNMVSEWDFLYNKAHNEYLNFLATTGIFGLASYFLLIVTIIVITIKKLIFTNPNRTDNTQPTSNNFISIALFSGWVTLLVTNFFGFSVVVTQILFFLYPAILIVATSSSQSIKKRLVTLKLPSYGMTLSYLVIWVLASWILVTLGVLWYADTLYASAYRANRSNQPLTAQPLLRQASALNATEPLYRDELSSSLATLAMIAAENKQASQASQLAQLSLLENDAAIAISPQNINFWKTRTKIFYQLATYDPKLISESIKALEIARELSPKDPKILYNLAVLYGRNNQNELAINTLLAAKEMKPNYREVYNALHVFYTDLKETAKAQVVLTEYVTKVDPNDRDFQEKLKQ